MSNLPKSFDPSNQFYACESHAMEFVNMHLTEEMEGLLILRFGDAELCVKILDACQQYDRILDHNYHAEKHDYDGQNVPDELETFLCEHDEQFFAVVTELRKEWGLEYCGYGFDYFHSESYKTQLKEWEKTPEGIKRMKECA